MNRSTILIYAVCLSPFLTQAGRSQTVVVPNSLADVEAAHDWTLTGMGFRMQQGFPASQFDSLPGPLWITEIAYRPDGTLLWPQCVSWGDVEIRLSTTQASPTNLGRDFAANPGDDETVIYEGELQLCTENTGPAAGPKDFDYIIELDEPFRYDPERGHLLLDWTSFGSPSENAHFDWNLSGEEVGRSVIAYCRRDFQAKPEQFDCADSECRDPNDPTACDFGGWVTQFTFADLDPPLRFRRGDCNGDGGVDIADAVCILNWLFASGAAPGCVAATNTDGADDTNLADATYLLNHLFAGGPAPAQPFPECGASSSAEEQLCADPPPDCR